MARALAFPAPVFGLMPLVLDDFTRDASASRWASFTDQVMGGVSTGGMSIAMVQGRRALRLRGTVSLERNGGFVQMARPFGGSESTPFDATSYRGILLTVCGTPGSYFVHLRTSDSRAPWQYYGCELPVTSAWADVTLRFEWFSPVSLRSPLNVARLLRLGLVAGFSAFQADLAVARVVLVP